MRKPPPPLMAIFRTQLQGRVLAQVYLRPEAAVSISELARELDAPVATVHREVSRLIEAGLLAETKVGRTRLIERPGNDLVSRPLTDLLAVTFGPLPVLADLLRDVEGVDESYIYGSWAARYRGEPGPPPHDVDVLVVGDADRDALDEVAEQASKQLRREVSVRRVRPDRWDAPGDDPFLTHVKERPLVRLTGQSEEAT